MQYGIEISKFILYNIFIVNELLLMTNDLTRYSNTLAYVLNCFATFFMYSYFSSPVVLKM